VANKKDDTIKELVVGATGVAAAVTGIPGALAVALASIVGIGFVRVKERDNRRARRLLERMAEADESPEEFVEHLRERLEAEDEDTLTAFRALLIAAVEAITPNAIAPLGFIGRRYLRGECPTWIARGIVEVLQRVDSAEIEALRRLLVEIEPIKSDGIMITADVSSHRWCAYQRSLPDDLHPITPFPSARRVFGYLKRAGLGGEWNVVGFSGPSGVLDIDRAVADVLREALVLGETQSGTMTTDQ